jgi:hypothetical protein
MISWLLPLASDLAQALVNLIRHPLVEYRCEFDDVAD